MNTKMIICLVAATLVSTASFVHAQQSKKVPRIGYLTANYLSTISPLIEAFGQGLRELGYVEGKNIVIEYRYADTKLDRLPALADELVRLKVDVLVVGGPPVAVAAKNATRTIPIVFYSVADPVALGLVDSLARPGGNVTGFTIITEVLAGKRLELLKETVPKLSQVAVLWNPQNPGNALQWKESQLQARALGLQLYSMEVTNADKLQTAFKEAAKARSGALAVTQDTVFGSNLKLIADLAIKYRWAAIYTRREFVETGGLMSYGADQAEQVRRVVALVDKILRGAKPGDLPVEQPMKFEFIISLKAAKQIGLTIPPNVLARADKVIK